MVYTYKQKFNKKYGFKLNEPHNLKEISDITGYKLKGIKTIFEKGQEIESRENRLILFDGRLKHAGTTSTDSKRRILINFNYLNSEIK